MSALSQRKYADSTVAPFLLLAVVWGSSFPAIEVGVAHLPPLLLAGARYVVAGAVVFGYAAVTADRILPRTRAEFAAVAAAGAFTFAGYQAFLFIGEQYVSGSIAAVVISLSPVLTSVLAGPVLGEARDATDGIGFLLGIVGVALVARPEAGFAQFLSGGAGGTTLTVAGTALTLNPTVIGVVLVLLGTLSFSLGAVFTRSLETALPVETLQSWAMLGGAVVLLAGAHARGESVPALETIPPAALVALAYVALVSGALGYVIYFHLLDTAGATETTLVAYLEPIVATAVAAGVLGHAVAPTTLAGFTVVLAGFLVVKRQQVGHVVRSGYAEVAEVSYDSR
jgi:drug/metabolite transporter (DMT)-like permease